MEWVQKHFLFLYIISLTGLNHTWLASIFDIKWSIPSKVSGSSTPSFLLRLTPLTLMLIASSTFLCKCLVSFSMIFIHSISGGGISAMCPVVFWCWLRADVLCLLHLLICHVAPLSPLMISPCLTSVSLTHSHLALCLINYPTLFTGLHFIFTMYKVMAEGLVCLMVKVNIRLLEATLQPFTQSLATSFPWTK